MRFYFLLNRFWWRSSYIGKILTISFIGVHVPMIGTVIWILAGSGLPVSRLWTVLAAMLAATLVGTGATLACIYALLTPVRVAIKSIHSYLTDRAVPSLPTTAQDEVGVLMASIQEGVTRLDAALDAANSRADEAVLRKRENFALLSRLSHDFRTPLNHIIGFAEMMSNEALGPIGGATYKEYAGNIGASGGDLLAALQTVLDLSQAEAGALDPERRAVVLAREAEPALALVHLEAQRAHVALRPRLSEPARLWCDPRLLKQILLHALRAAIGPGADKAATLTMSARSDGARCRIEIEQDGAPWFAEDLPPALLADLPHAKPFSGADGVYAQATRAALHLALVQSLARMCDGNVTVSNPLLGGRALRIDLPATPPPTIAPAPAKELEPAGA